MSRLVVFAVAVAVGGVSAVAAETAAGTWTCTAPGLVSASYDGGAAAYVHLVGFAYGGTYAVTLNAKKTVATGTTANGTRFTCTRS